jgi:predicted nucleotidyltransferase
MRPSPASALYHPLDQILGSPALVRVVRVLAGHGGSLAVADLSRRTKLSLPSVRAALRRLLDVELAGVVGAGRSLVCELSKDHPLGPALIALFDAERKQADTVFRSVRTAAASLDPRPLGVWLFGSVTRGEDEAASDIDVAVVSAQSRVTAQAEALRDAIARALPAQVHRISVVALSPGDVRRLAVNRGKFWRELERDAVVLLGDAPTQIVQRASKARTH